MFSFQSYTADVYEDVVGHTLGIFDEHCHHLDRHQLVANCFDTFNFMNKKSKGDTVQTLTKDDRRHTYIHKHMYSGWLHIGVH